MAITLGSIKQFISDNANNASDTMADRVMDRIVQDALRELGRRHDWKFLEKRERLTTAPPETYTSVVNATQDSGDFVLSSGAFLDKYATGKWDMLLSSAPYVPFRAASIETTSTADDTFRCATGEVWSAASATGLSATLYKTVYQLTNPVQKLLSVRTMDTGRRMLRVVGRDCYEFLARLHTTAAAQPCEATMLSPLELGLWPLPDQRYDLELFFIRKIQVPADGAADAVELDWPDEMLDLLRARCKLEILDRFSDEGVPFDGAQARATYQERLDGYRQEQGVRMRETFSLRAGTSSGVRDPYYQFRNPVSDP